MFLHLRHGIVYVTSRIYRLQIPNFMAYWCFIQVVTVSLLILLFTISVQIVKYGFLSRGKLNLYIVLDWFSICISIFVSNFTVHVKLYYHNASCKFILCAQICENILNILGNHLNHLSSELNEDFVTAWSYQFVFVSQYSHASLNL